MRAEMKILPRSLRTIRDVDSRGIRWISLAVLSVLLGRYLWYCYRDFGNLPLALDDMLAFLRRFHMAISNGRIRGMWSGLPLPLTTGPI